MRRVWVDNLRCFTVLLVVLYHCFYIFNSVGVFGGIGPLRPGDGQVQDIVEYTMYPWFMVLLFLLAGMSAKWSLDKRSTREFIKSRSLKLLIPGIAGLFVIHWITGYFNVLAGAGMQQFAQMPLLLKWLVFSLSGTGPLWFIQLLWLYSLLAALIRTIDKQCKVNALMSKALDSWIGLAATGVAFFLLSWGGSLLTSYNTPLMGLYRPLVYLVPFLLGYFAFSDDKMLDRLGRLSIPAIPVFIAMAVLYVLRWFPQNYGDGTVQQHWTTMLFATLGSLCMMAIFRRWCDRECRLGDFLIPRSYGIYILHYIPLLVMAYFLKNSSVIPPVATYAILIIATPVASIALYELLSRVPAVRTLVFGIRKRA